MCSFAYGTLNATKRPVVNCAITKRSPRRSNTKTHYSVGMRVPDVVREVGPRLWRVIREICNELDDHPASHDIRSDQSLAGFQCVMISQRQGNSSGRLFHGGTEGDCQH